MNVLTIDCGDIILREYQENDLDGIYQITRQPEIAQFLPDWVAPKEKRAEWLTKYELPENRAFFDSIPNISDNILRLVIVLKETNQLIGWIVSGIKDGVPVPNREIGYAVSNEYTRKGYATKAVKGLSYFLSHFTDTTELVAVALTYNVPSNHVIRKCGFQFIDVIDLEGKDYNYYRLTEKNLCEGSYTIHTKMNHVKYIK